MFMIKAKLAWAQPNEHLSSDEVGCSAFDMVNRFEKDVLIEIPAKLSETD